MKQLNHIRSGAIIAALVLSTFSCKKDSSSGSSTTDDQTTVTLATGATGAESLYDDTFDVVTQSGAQSGVNGTALAVNPVNVKAVNRSLDAFQAVACAQITLSPADSTSFPKTMTIDYGTGCTSSNGITRVGKLSVTLTGKLRNPGSVISVTFDNYSVNGYQLQGTYSMTPVAGADSGINFNISVSNATITTPSNAVYTYSGSETFTQVAGIGTTTVTDDTYNITGNLSYSGGGLTVSGTIVNPLVRSADCPNITSGTIDYVYKNIKGVLDFGSGTCDNVATMTAGPITNTITLPR